MGEIGAVIGIITGLISIFTFVTGASSLQLLRAESRAAEGNAQQPRPRPRVYIRSRLFVWLTFAVFVASLAATLAMGLSGGDVEGAVFVLLLLGGVGVAAFVLRFRHAISPLAFGVASTLVLGGVGFALGSVSRGEEAVDAVAGVVIGLCITGIAWLFRPDDGPDDGARGEVAPAVPEVAPKAASAAAPATRASRAPAAVDSERENAREREVLGLAAGQAGEVTIASVALHTQIPLDDARTLLDSLHERGFCERARTEQGATVYRFPDLA
ncbi:MAG: hypothetical protein O3B08_00730 [Proteobacteria bacterium]|nr:hypothetical protein [Pseudomonadota bacterium]